MGTMKKYRNARILNARSTCYEYLFFFISSRPTQGESFPCFFDAIEILLAHGYYERREKRFYSPSPAYLLQLWNAWIGSSRKSSFAKSLRIVRSIKYRIRCFAGNIGSLDNSELYSCVAGNIAGDELADAFAFLANCAVWWLRLSDASNSSGKLPTYGGKFLPASSHPSSIRFKMPGIALSLAKSREYTQGMPGGNHYHVTGKK